MKRISLLIICFLSVFSLFSQEIKIEAIDFKKIKKNVEKEKSPFFYESLFTKYTNNDTSFTLEEKRYLYYGFAFQDKYSPYGVCAFSDSIDLVFEKDTLSGDDYLVIMNFALICLEKNPFDIKSLEALAYAYSQMGDEKKQELTFYKIGIIYDAILSSGDGISDKSAFTVLFIAHEYDLISTLGLAFGGQQSLVDGQFDYLNLAENEYGIEGFYFDISKMMDSFSNSFR